MTRTTTTARFRAGRIAAVITLLAGLAWQGVALARTDDLAAPSGTNMLAAAADQWVDKPLQLTMVPQTSPTVLQGKLTLHRNGSATMSGASGVAGLLPNLGPKTPDTILQIGTCTWKNGSATYQQGNPKTVTCILTRLDTGSEYSLTMDVTGTHGLGKPVMVGVYYVTPAGVPLVQEQLFLSGVVQITL